MEDVATEHFGASLSETRVLHLLSVLHHEQTGKGFLGQLRVKGDESDLLGGAKRRAHGAREAARHFFDLWVDYAGGGGGLYSASGKTQRVREAGVVENVLSPAFGQLATSLRRLREVSGEEDALELSAYAERAQSIATDAALVVDQEIPGCAYWVEVKPSLGGRSLRATVAGSPIDVGPVLEEKLFGGEHSVVMTSATLTTGKSRDGGGDFRHVAERVGFDLEDDGAETLALGSPFEYASQVELYVERAMPDPRESGYGAALAERVAHHVIETGGGAFVLFTSLRTLSTVAGLVRGRLAREGIEVFAQGEDGPRSLLLQKFRSAEKGALFGAASFWQGVDVRGAALRNVVITRLPFEPPDRPIVEARAERITERGGNPFMEDALPRAVIRFKQGFGRLIRSSGDRGRVVVLDPRVATKRYGGLFLRALPEGVEVVKG